ncbi:hypothetical protein CHLRE_14g611484v5 [Chlamydomonas reinhardtii]|uniref:Phosphotyrosine protein phosphatase I domain-containing protein n=1 Tax=Chlamydomonas reinhardtii TaxID=3055 RepID=A0A2K3CXB3_CHLRE|nr:uncharacterized protein CHLRE_14g611484v5 [Chlamydomonas reinhardtii]PNW72913.1 hypothetical protein CHLRE_14g611484v5 [Chlamydomonas reinhardtii]
MQSSLALRSGESTLHTHRGSNKCSLTVRGIQRRACRHHTPLAPQAAAGFPTSSPPEPDKAGSSSSSSSTAAAAVPQSLAHLWPKVSWSRYHLQVLFVDQTDTVRGRLAAGLFERCAEWNGYGRALYPWSAGLAPGGPRDIHAISKLTALMRGATSLEILPRYFTRPPEAFELEDLDRYDLVLALDRSVHEALHGSIAAEYPPGPDRDYYMQKVCLLTTFSHYESDAVLTRRGGFALLPAQLSYLLKDGAGGLAASKAVVDIPSPDLSSPDGAAQWEAVVAALILSTASLVKYLVDAYPEDMPHYDPQD